MEILWWIINSGYWSKEDDVFECLWCFVLNNVVIMWINEYFNFFSGCYFNIVLKLFNLIWIFWKIESVVCEIFKRVVVSLCEWWKGICWLILNIFVLFFVFFDEGWLIFFL